tara:strand:+ start:2683 stop:3948 length:1266 start_codon:yes stop_codon:yes gene_type:complete
MNFEDSVEEATYRREVYNWLVANAELRLPGELPASIAERENPAQIKAAQDWQARKFDAGWACITWPREYGGCDGTAMEAVIWQQEQAKFRIPPEVFTIGIGMAAPTIMHYGTPEQKAQWLPRCARGDEIWCQLFSEPSAGSDLASLRTKAVKDGDEWVVNGQKIWTSGGHYADWGILLARTDFDAPKHAGITFFVVDMKSPGIETRRIRQITGDANFNEVYFTDLRIPDDNRISEVGNGWRVALTTLMMERGAINLDSPGGVSLDDLFELANEVAVDGKLAIEQEGIREQLADYYTKTTALRFLSFRNLTTLSRGGALGPSAAIVKLVTGKLRQQMGALGMELQGSAGALEEREGTANNGGWQYAYLYSPGVRVAGGTDEIMRNVIAERVLGMPQEPRVDKSMSFREFQTRQKKPRTSGSQ